jgi:prolyl oligopeptidase
MDMLRFHKFTIGHAWCSDFGNPDEKAHMENNLKYSPLHNIRQPEVRILHFVLIFYNN